MMKFSRQLSKIIIFLIMVLSASLAGCGGHSPAWEQLGMAEMVMEEHPDSALAVLRGIDASVLKGREEKARYALLMSQAMDKNYIDTTRFDVLQPAIDYYLKKGTPDEKLKTLYYQGIIYLNANDRSKASRSMLKCIDMANECSDSLTLARAHVVLARVYYDFYDFNLSYRHYRDAATIYEGLSLNRLGFIRRLDALNIAILLNDKVKADSMMNILKGYDEIDENENKRLTGYKLSYILKFGTDRELRSFLEKTRMDSLYDMNDYLDLASAYNRLQDDNKALKILNLVHESGEEYDTLKYEATAVFIYEALRNYEKAFNIYVDFGSRISQNNVTKFNKSIRFIEDRHEMELQTSQENIRKSRIIWGFIGGLAILLMAVVILILLLRSSGIQKSLARQIAESERLENEKLEAEQERLRIEQERLGLENENLRLEREKKELEIENQANRLAALEDESERLRDMLDTQMNMSQDIREVLQKRLGLLNSLFAGLIASRDNTEGTFHDRIEAIKEDTESFMDSTRLAFKASHPRFYAYLAEHGLTLKEINYACLYALGLRGKEVGNYIKKPSHVNMSSAIRKKLGLEKNSTNIGIFIRKRLDELK